MSLKLRLLLYLNTLFTKRETPPRGDISAYVQWQFENARRLYQRYQQLYDFKNKLLLDIACGPGGKTICYAFEREVLKCLGVDINLGNLEVANREARERQVQDVVMFSKADAASLPFRDSSFDVIVCNDALEHLSDVQGALAEANRLLSPGGWMFLEFAPYFGLTGAHLYDFISVPLVQVLFPDPVIKDALKILGGAAGQAEADFFASCLNRITIRQFRGALKKGEWELIRFRRNHSHTWQRLLLYCPYLEDMVTNDVICVIRKSPGCYLTFLDFTREDARDAIEAISRFLTSLSNWTRGIFHVGVSP